MHFHVWRKSGVLEVHKPQEDFVFGRGSLAFPYLGMSLNWGTLPAGLPLALLNRQLEPSKNRVEVHIKSGLGRGRTWESPKILRVAPHAFQGSSTRNHQKLSGKRLVETNDG